MYTSIRRSLGKSLRGALKAFVPSPMVHSLISEAKISLHHCRSLLRRRSQFGGRRALRVNVGCGLQPLSGWSNLDIIKAPNVFYWDCRRGLPFDDNSVSFIFAEHFFEHLEYPNETSQFLKACLRCLHPGGIIRIVVPDAGMYLRLYNQEGWDALVTARPLERLGAKYRDCWHGKSTYETKMQLINAVFRQFGEHKYAYDVDTLVLHLQQVGFSECTPQKFGLSFAEEAPPDKPARQTESLYVEALKATTRAMATSM